jgi:ribosomal protein S18 acetylase RimI-like enzyme
MASTYTYSFFRISKTDNIEASSQEYRDLRLNALKASPGSFASTYETESLFTDANWKNLITVPDRDVFICVATPVHDQSQTKWIGQVTLRGPISKADFILPEESGQPVQKPNDEEECWQMLSLFTLPDHRGHGLGAKLCQNALDYLRSYRASPQGIQVRLMVKPENHVTVNLYKRLGFDLVGRATLVEALIANGDEHLLPDDRSSAKWSERTGLIMILRMGRL